MERDGELGGCGFRGHCVEESPILCGTAGPMSCKEAAALQEEGGAAGCAPATPLAPWAHPGWALPGTGQESGVHLKGLRLEGERRRVSDTRLLSHPVTGT